jgi:hypothetical protein
MNFANSMQSTGFVVTRGAGGAWMRDGKCGIVAEATARWTNAAAQKVYIKRMVKQGIFWGLEVGNLRGVGGESAQWNVLCS